MPLLQHASSGSQCCRTFPTSPLRSCALSVTRLSSPCLLQVRNAASTIVQLTYGDDGLDPVHMEGKDGSPIDLGRALSFIQATHPRHVPCPRLCDEHFRGVAAPSCTCLCFFLSRASLGQMCPSSRSPMKGKSTRWPGA